MQIKIPVVLIKVVTDFPFPDNTTSTGVDIPLGNNPCLSDIITHTFGWGQVEIEISDIKGKQILVRGSIKGRKIIFLPHFSYGPYLPGEVVSSVLTHLKERGYQCEWRLTEKASDHCITSKTTSLIHLSVDEETRFFRFSSNTRRKIRKSASNGIVIKAGKAELLADFYSVYTRRMHELGSPALCYEWFQNLIGEYRNGEAMLWCAYLNSKPVGAALVLEYQKFYEACWMATLQEFNRLYTSYGLIWAMVRYAISRSGRIFSLGRSTTGSSVQQFKDQWSDTHIPLYWNYTGTLGVSARSLGFLSAIWRLIPYPVALKIGPWFAKRIY